MKRLPIATQSRTLVGYLTVMISLTVVRILNGLGILDMIDMDVSDTFTLLVQIVCMGLVPALFVIQMSEEKVLVDRFVHLRRHLSFRVRFPGKVWLVVIALSVLQVWLNAGVSTVWDMMLGGIGYSRGISYPETFGGVGGLLMGILMTAVLPGFFEEFTHRGFLLRGVHRNPHTAIFMSALMFALMHQNIVQTGYTFVGGIVFGYIAMYTGSVVPAMVAHFYNNLISVLYSYSYEVDGLIYRLVGGFYSMTVEWWGMILAVLGFVAVVVVSYLLVRWLIRARIAEPVTVERALFSEKLLVKGLYIAILVLGAVTTLYSLVWGILR